jgi:hypothetical protein
MLIVTPFAVFLIFALALIFSPRMRGVLVVTGGCIVIFALPGLASDPGAAWAIIFAAVIFCFFVWLIVRAMANDKKKRDEIEDQALEKLQQQMIERQRARTFGKFRPRG